ncbi:hypothetical protein K376_06319 [Streptomyces sp. PsTaAH-130]|nr:hypothetical protein K376_06319 [Streptomyces sp. PsTaAH-130]
MVKRRQRGGFSVPYKSPRSTVMEKGAVAFTVPVNISPIPLRPAYCCEVPGRLTREGEGPPAT